MNNDFAIMSEFRNRSDITDVKKDNIQSTDIEAWFKTVKIKISYRKFGKILQNIAI